MQKRTPFVLLGLNTTYKIHTLARNRRGDSPNRFVEMNDNLVLSIRKMNRDETPHLAQNVMIDRSSGSGKRADFLFSIMLLNTSVLEHVAVNAALP